MENTSTHTESTDSTEVTRSNVQKHQTGNACSPDQTRKHLMSQDMVPTSINKPGASMGLGACDVMKEACSYVESVMTSQTITPVIEIAEITENTKTPITNS